MHYDKSLNRARAMFAIPKLEAVKLYVILSSSDILAYLLIKRGEFDYVVHQGGQDVLHFMNTGSKSAILSITVYGLSLSLCLFGPFAGYGVYNVEYAKLVCVLRPLDLLV